MTHHPRKYLASRHHLLGSAGLALAFMLAAPAAAQVALVAATGDHVLTNQQLTPVGVTEASADSGPATFVDGPSTGLTLAVRGNSNSAGSASNRADLRLAQGPAGTGSSASGSRLSASAAGVSAAGGTVIASWQDMGRAASRASTEGTGFGVGTDKVADSAIAVSGNMADASATGSEASAAIVLPAESPGEGAGIASLQTGAAGSVLASARDQIGIATGSVDSSSLTTGDNLVRSVATGNASTNSLLANGTAIRAPAAPGYASAVLFDEASTTVVTSDLAILNDQLVGGAVRATSGSNRTPAYSNVLDGTVTGSSVRTEDNVLVAAGYGNRSANTLDIAATSITAVPASEGPARASVATITGVQRIGDGTSITAGSAGGAATRVSGELADATLSVSRNNVRTVATGNVASGNQLTVKGAAIDAREAGWGTDPAGSVLVGSGGARANAAFSVHNVQDYGNATITAFQAGAGAGISIAGPASGSLVQADGNVEAVGATGNDAANGIVIDAAAVRTNAAINSLQSGEGDVGATLGMAAARAGSTIAAVGPVEGSRLSVSGNSSTASAIGDSARNSLMVSAGTVASGSDGAGASSGTMPASTQGAVGSFALASNQKLGQPSFGATRTPSISSTLVGVFGVTGAGPVSGSSVSVDDNQQRANAVGNSAVNRFGVSAASIGNAGFAPGTALYTSQFGQAQVSALSDVLLALPDSVATSTGSLSRNANVALAAINDVDNGISVTGPGGEGIASAVLDKTAVPQATGDVAITTLQVAWGSADAVATTRVGTAGSLDAARLGIADNVTSAEAAANRALNSASVTSGIGSSGLALANQQTGNFARVTAMAAIDMAGSGLGSDLKGSDISVTGNRVSALARGNAAENALNLQGGGSSAPASATVASPLGAATAAAALLNTQTNYGAVLATASFMSPLNTGEPMRNATVSATDNAVLASAYGNAVTNSVSTTGGRGVPGAAIASLQSNYANIIAETKGQGYRFTGPMAGSSLAIAGNQFGAVATGNQATNIIGLTR